MNTFTFCSNESLAFWVGVQIPFRLSLRTDFHPGQSYFRSMTGPLSWCSTLAALCRHMLFRYKMLLVCAYVRVHGCMCLYLQVYMCVYMCTSESRRQPLVQFLRSNPSFFVRGSLTGLKLAKYARPACETQESVVSTSSALGFQACAMFAFKMWVLQIKQILEYASQAFYQLSHLLSPEDAIFNEKFFTRNSFMLSVICCLININSKSVPGE